MAQQWRGGDEIPAAAVKAVRLTARWGPILAAYWLGRTRGRVIGMIEAAGQLVSAQLEALAREHELEARPARRSLRAGRWL